MYKRFKMEFGLGLAGSIAGIAAFVYALYHTLKHYVVESVVGLPVYIVPSLLLAAFALAFVGAGILYAGKKFGGVVLMLSGLLTLGAAVLSFDAAWAALLVFPFTMLSGVLAISKRMPDGKAPFNQTYVNSLDGLK